MNDELSTWLSQQLKQRNWSHNELARRAGVSQSAVSGTLSGSRKAGAEFCVKVANALGESPEQMLRLAGILPSLSSSEDATLQELMELARTLPPDQRQQILDYVRFLSQQRGEE